MAIDKKRAEKARKSQLEGFINTCLPLDRQPSSGETEKRGSLSDPIKAVSAESPKRKKNPPDYIRLGPLAGADGAVGGDGPVLWQEPRNGRPRK